jgi:hypothetical protein
MVVDSVRHVEESALPRSLTKKEYTKVISDIMLRMAERSDNDGEVGVWMFRSVM